MRTLPFLFLLFVPCLSVAAPVLIGDASFEGNNLDPGSWSTDLSPEWQETGGPSNGAGFEEYIAGFAADGNDHIGMNSGHAIWQDLGETYQANTIYTLTISAGNRAGQTNGGNQTNYVLTAPSGTIFASSSFDASTIPAGTFSDAPALIFDTASNPAAVGQTIRILLSGAGSGRSHFDHIRLDATSSEPDGSATLSNLPATDINPTSARLSGRHWRGGPFDHYFLRDGRWRHGSRILGFVDRSFRNHVRRLFQHRKLIGSLSILLLHCPRNQQFGNLMGHTFSYFPNPSQSSPGLVGKRNRNHCRFRDRSCHYR
ncbi:MAG: hypothetical protein ACPGAP_08405 [Akkermansiaceae bacterium]